MAHEINFNEKKGTHSFATYGEKAWHGLGQIVEKAMTAAEAIELANLDYEVQKAPVHAEIVNEDGSISTPIFKDRFATYRTDNNALLGQVSSRYEIVQNKDAFLFFDSIIDSGEAIFETAGALLEGQKIFVTAKLPDDILVGGEPCNKYIMLTTGHDAKSPIIAGFTPIRVVCNNTLQAAMRGLDNKVVINHTASAKGRLSEASKVMNIGSKYMVEVEAMFNDMAKKTITDQQLKSYIENVMRPETKLMDEEEEYEVSSFFKKRVDSIYSFALSHPTQVTRAAEGTVWGAYNAISGHFNHNVKFEDSEKKFRSLMFGNANNYIQKGFKKALELTHS